MKSINFEESNVGLGKPDSMSDDECGSLEVFTDGFVCISCWKPTFLGRLKILFTGRVWLGVLSGQTQPPVWVKADYPFVKSPPPTTSIGGDES